MNSIQKAVRVIAAEGPSGFSRRLARKLAASIRRRRQSFATPSRPDIVTEYAALVEEFNRRVRSEGYDDAAEYFWYHTVDLGNGLITPGVYDYRNSIAQFRFPALNGLNVLEVGSATGFFSFEFEKLGATVTSTELPSAADFDLFPGETVEQCHNKLDRALRSNEELLPPALRHSRFFHGRTADETYRYLIDGPFRFCQEILQSKVRRVYSTAYDLEENLDSEEFDLVFLGDILLHTVYPLKALAAAAAVCRGTLIIAQDMADEAEPAVKYIGGDTVGEDYESWWLPNRLCFEQILKKLGFRDVAFVGTHSGFMRPSGVHFVRTVTHAAR